MDSVDINSVQTTGASPETARQDGLEYSEKGVDPALIAAIISRESRAGKTLEDGYGDYSRQRGAYNGFGLMQVDVNPNGGAHEPEVDWDSEEHLRQATDILIGFVKKIKKKFPNWCKAQQLKGGIAAYNMGDKNVHSYDKVDVNTTGGDYSNDVVARAQWYKKNDFAEESWCSVM